MSEKVIHEVRIVETEDGFRIEIKGDKERLRQMGLGEGQFPFGFGRMGHGPFGHGPRGFGFGRRRAPWWGWGEAENPGDEQGERKV